VTAPLRRTKAQMGQLRRQIYSLLEVEHPQSVRQVFFRMTDPGLPEPVAESFGGYITVQRLLVRMRGAKGPSPATGSSRTPTVGGGR
jgi:hypothetical protein